MAFCGIIGKEAFQESLFRAIGNNRISHAYIFEGQKGTGKKTIARHFGKILLCEAPVRNDACGKCGHCRILGAGGKGELYVLEKEKSISVEDIRNLQKDVVLLPVNSKRKVYLIIDGDNMTPQAQNCLLKTMEEPPPHCFIIITAVDSEKLLETIISRAVVLQTGINTPGEIRVWLDEKSAATSEEKMHAALHAEGSMGKALEILESRNYRELREKAVDYIKAILNGDSTGSFRLIKEINGDWATSFLEFLTGFFKDMALYGTVPEESRLHNPDKLDMIVEGSNRYHAPVLTRVVFIIYDAIYKLNMNASLRMTLDAMNIKILEELSK
ncbi:MAG: hypothetical protein R6W96_06150 [Clostridia bacterium]